MTPKDPRLYLIHMRECCVRIIDYTAGLGANWADTSGVIEFRGRFADNLKIATDRIQHNRVSYHPGDNLPVHDHPAFPTVYIYVTDGGPIQFGHQEFPGLRRPEVKAGQIRFNRGNKETHTTEYLGEFPSEYLRIELKTEPLDLPRRDVRIASDDSTPFENGQLRIERVACSPCGDLPGPAVVVTMADRSAHWVTVKPPDGPQIRVVLKSKPNN